MAIKPIAVIEEKPHNYHIKIAGAKKRMYTKESCQAKINAFLTDLFDNDSEEPAFDDSPLEFSRHDFSEDTSNTSSNILLVELRLTGGAQAANITLDLAAERFCRLMFDPRTRGILGTLTPHGLLGVSALSGPFKTYWTQTFFRDYMTHGPRLLRLIDTTFSDYLAEWALVLGSAVIGGLRPRAFAPDTSRPSNPTEPPGTEVTLASSILGRYTRRNEVSVAELEKNWMHEHSELTRCIDTVSQRLKEVTDPTTLGNNQLRQHYELCDVLYDATLVAAKTFTSNQDTFNEFVRLRNQAVVDATSRGFAAALTSWPLVDAAVFITRAPALCSTSLFVAWPVAIAAAGFSTFFGVKGYLKMKEHEKLRKQADYHMRMNTIIGRTWSLVYSTHTLLRWIHITDAFSGHVEFVDDCAQSDWARFIESVRAATGGNSTGADLGPQMVLAYLSEQSRSLRNLRVALSRED